MIFVEETLPSEALEAEVVLHVREHLRRKIRRGGDDVIDNLAFLFDCEVTARSRVDWLEAAAAREKETAAAELTARIAGRERDGAVALGHSPTFVARCHQWLKKRKDDEPAFKAIYASDLGTLLVLSRARDLAVATAPHGDQERNGLPLIVRGATGTGKELLARAIHQIWAREKKQAGGFHVVHVAGMPKELISDELFGHAKGAYTGATAERKGKLEAANGGTVLIDEVGDLPQDAQVRLLRFLQDQTLERLGGGKPVQVRVRVLAATWHDLDADVKAGNFRADLLYRLRGASDLVLPALDERDNYGYELVPEILKSRRQYSCSHTRGISHAAIQALGCHRWAGNLRELAAVLDEASESAGDGIVRPENLRFGIQRAFLRLPMWKRLPAVIADAHEAHATPAALEAIIRRAIRESEQLVPAKASTGTIAEAAYFKELASILERSQDSAGDLDEAVRLEVEIDRARAMGEILAALVAVPHVPSEVLPLLASMRDQYGKQQRECMSELERLQQAAAIKNNQWLAVVGEITAAFPAVGRDVVQKVIVALVRLVAAVGGPSARDAVDRVVRDGGLRAIRAKMLEAIQEDDHGPDEAQGTKPDEMEGDPPDPNTLSAKELEELLMEFGSVSGLARHFRRSEPTIRKRMKELGIDTPRQQKRSASITR